MNPWIPVIALTLTLGPAIGAEAATTPLWLVESSVARAAAIVQSSAPDSEARRAGLNRVSRELFDFDQIARRSLGQYWKTASSAEHGEFVQLFTGILDRAFLAGFAGYAGESVAFTGEAIDGAWAQVHARITPGKGAPIAIEFRLHAPHGRWTVYDVVMEHGSLVASYRTRFNAVIRASSFAHLLERMRADGIPRGERMQVAALPDRFVAGLLLGVLTRRGAQTWP